MEEEIERHVRHAVRTHRRRRRTRPQTGCARKPRTSRRQFLWVQRRRWHASAKKPSALLCPAHAFAMKLKWLRRRTPPRSAFAADFYTESPARVCRVAEAREMRHCRHQRRRYLCGGVKQSGYGREGSVHGFDDYQQIKYLCQGGLQRPAPQSPKRSVCGRGSASRSELEAVECHRRWHMRQPACRGRAASAASRMQQRHT